MNKKFIGGLKGEPKIEETPQIWDENMINDSYEEKIEIIIEENAEWIIEEQKILEYIITTEPRGMIN